MLQGASTINSFEGLWLENCLSSSLLKSSMMAPKCLVKGLMFVYVAINWKTMRVLVDAWVSC